jgi:hypothetical protein
VHRLEVDEHPAGVRIAGGGEVGGREVADADVPHRLQHPVPRRMDVEVGNDHRRVDQ